MRTRSVSGYLLRILSHAKQICISSIFHPLTTDLLEPNMKLISRRLLPEMEEEQLSLLPEDPEDMVGISHPRPSFVCDASANSCPASGTHITSSLSATL